MDLTSGSTITFSCTTCNHEFTVGSEKAGNRGKCPKCHAVLVVPEQDQNELIFDEDAMTCNDPMLQHVYECILASAEDRILRHHIHDQDVLAFEVATDTNATRRQVVKIVRSEEDDPDHRRMLMFTFIGSLLEFEETATVLRWAWEYPEINLAIDENGLLVARLIQELRNVDEYLAVNNLLLLAAVGDELEASLFGWDEG